MTLLRCEMASQRGLRHMKSKQRLCLHKLRVTDDLLDIIINMSQTASEHVSSPFTHFSTLLTASKLWALFGHIGPFQWNGSADAFSETSRAVGFLTQALTPLWLRRHGCHTWE